MASSLTESVLPAEQAEFEAAKKRVAARRAEVDEADKVRSNPRATAESMATRQRDISVSEFFAKNRHLLGFDNPRKALLTTVKEAVDNSLDACEEAGILPDITVVIEDLQPDRPASAKSSRYRITAVDNGPGIIRKQVENVFGRLLFGSKFHRLKMSRGQQGIGISAAGMYGLITTGKPMSIQTRPAAHKPALYVELAMNTKTNRAEVTVDKETDDFPLQRLRDLNSAVRELVGRDEFLSAINYPTGTSVSIELEGKYQRGRGSVDEFLELTAIANAHARITLVRPTRLTDEETEDEAPLLKIKKASAPAPGIRTAGEEQAPPVVAEPEVEAVRKPKLNIATQDLGPLVIFPRNVDELPPETREIQPHPKGIELGILLQMIKEAESESKSQTLFNFLQEKFSRVSPAAASKFCEAIMKSSRSKLGDVDHANAEKLYKAMQEATLPPPPTDCLAPIGVRQLLAGLLKGVKAEFYAASSREAAVYRGRPFQIEAAIAFGGDLPKDDSSRVIRFANRVPLLFQQSACSSMKAVSETNWRNYDLAQPRASLPVGPLVIMIHMASVWVPFTSESKEAIADYDEIRKEMKLALMECGRKLGTYLRKRAKMRRETERRDVFERYIGEIAKAVGAINGTEVKRLFEALQTQARKRTAIADLQLDEDGKAVKDEDPADQEGVIIIESAIADEGAAKVAPNKLMLGEIKPNAKVKIKAMSGDDEDEQPKLIDVDVAKRASAKSGKGSKAAKGSKGPKAERSSKAPNTLKAGKPAETKGEPAKVGKAAAPAVVAEPVSKPAKPKLRLNPKTGKLEPAGQAGLF